MKPNSNFVSARIRPTASARRAPSPYSASERSSSWRRQVGADHAGELLAGDVLVVADLRLGRRREDRLGQAIRLAQTRRAAGGRRPSRSAGTPPSRSRRGSRGRRTRRRRARRGARASSAAPSPGPRAASGSVAGSAVTKCERPRSASSLEPPGAAGASAPRPCPGSAGRRRRRTRVSRSVATRSRWSVVDLVGLAHLAAMHEPQPLEIGGGQGHVVSSSPSPSASVSSVRRLSARQPQAAPCVALDPVEERQDDEHQDRADHGHAVEAGPGRHADAGDRPQAGARS